MSGAVATPGGHEMGSASERQAEPMAPTEAVAGPAIGRAGLVLVGIGGLGAIALHVWLLGRSTVDADEAIVGMMAHQIVHGHFSAFYLGQHYGGDEAYVTAALYLVFGASAFTLKLTATVLAAGAALLTWRIGRRVCSPVVGVAAGLVCFVWPEVNDYASVKEFGFRWIGLFCGLVTLLMVARLADGDTRRATWVALGLALGVGWWSTPEIVYQAAPALAFLEWSIARHRAARLRPSALAGGLMGLVLGALPWLWSNFGDGFASLQRAGVNNYGKFFAGFFTEALPLALGLRLRSSPNWVLPVALAVAAYVLVLGGLIAELVSLWRRRRGGLIVLALLMFPFLHAALPVGYWFDGRFTLALGPVLSILFADGATNLAGVLATHLRARRARRAGAVVAVARRVHPELLGATAVVVLGWALTVSAVGRVTPERPSPIPQLDRAGWTSWRTDPNTIVDSAISLMSRHGVHDAYAGYWVAYPITELSGESILASDAPAPVRDPAEERTIAASPHPAWVFVTADAFPAASEELRQNVLNPGCTKRGYVCLTAHAFEAKLNAAHIGYQAWRNAAFVVVQPDRDLAPTWVLARPGA